MNTDAISMVNQADMTKETMNYISDTLLHEVNDGNAGPLETFIKCKFMLETLAQAMDKLKDSAIREAALYQKGERVLYGVGFNTSEGTERLDYEADAEYCRLKALLKAREDLIRQATKGKGATLDPGTGEVIDAVPVKASANSLTITFPK